MSAAASRLRLESPTAKQDVSLPAEEHEREALVQLTDTTGHVIAIDLDDVLSQTNQAIVDCKPFPVQR